MLHCSNEIVIVPKTKFGTNQGRTKLTFGWASNEIFDFKLESWIWILKKSQKPSWIDVEPKRMCKIPSQNLKSSSQNPKLKLYKKVPAWPNKNQPSLPNIRIRNISEIFYIFFFNFRLSWWYPNVSRFVHNVWKKSLIVLCSSDQFN